MKIKAFKNFYQTTWSFQKTSTVIIELGHEHRKTHK